MNEKMIGSTISIGDKLWKVNYNGDHINVCEVMVVRISLAVTEDGFIPTFALAIKQMDDEFKHIKLIGNEIRELYLTKEDALESLPAGLAVQIR